MAEDDDRVINRHFHVWPEGDCGIFALLAVTVVAVVLYELAKLKALPWQ